MPQITAMLLGRAISDALNPDHDDWNRAFRKAVEALPGLDPSFSVTANNLSSESSQNAYQVSVIVAAENQQMVATVSYRRFGVRDLSQPVIVS